MLQDRVIGCGEDVGLAEFLRALPREQFLTFLKRGFGERVEMRPEASFPVTQGAFDRLNGRDVENISEAVAARYGGEALHSLQRHKKENPPHYRREILRYGCSVCPDLMKQKTGMTNANPPPNVHSMIRQEPFAGDLYNGDMVAAAALRAGFRFEVGHNYLDFGCSSGALVRNMVSYFPEMHWHGCDPVATSIAWAAEHFPHIAFVRSTQEPPLPFPDSYFHGLYAVSIWSHFSERAALAWFDEAYRVIEPGGFLIFTTHGHRSVLYYLERSAFEQDVLASILATLIAKQYAFHAVWQDPSQEYDLQVTDWGMSYLTVEWVIKSLFRKFSLVDFSPGLSQINQDVYVLNRLR